MATVWLTYAWGDNENRDVDFAAQELDSVGVEVKLDRWNLQAGKRLWPQIEVFIQDPAHSDAWVLYATQNGLGSEACKEEFAIALDRALHTLDGTFPIIGLFPGPVDNSLIPVAIRTRLFVSLTDPDWKERIKAAAEGRAPSIARSNVQPYELQVYTLPSYPHIVIEVRPRAGSWAPFVAAVPAAEKDTINPYIVPGPRGRPTTGGMFLVEGEEEQLSPDGKWWIMQAQTECTPTQSYYVCCAETPSRLVFGVYKGQPQHVFSFQATEKP